PSTWRTWATDGDGDGTADPHDLDDAAAATARYLCAGGYDLASGTGWAARLSARAPPAPPACAGAPSRGRPFPGCVDWAETTPFRPDFVRLVTKRGAGGPGRRGRPVAGWIVSGVRRLVRNRTFSARFRAVSAQS
ncbi:MAG: lytic murein transglycosylase, partial [Nocardioides sp.]